MTNKHKLWSTILTITGYILSPLSWWNDLFVNLPIAYFVGGLFGLISRNLFAPTMILAYWLTNVLGLVMLHLGGECLIKNQQINLTRDKFCRNLAISVFYTLVVFILIKLQIIRFPLEY